VTKSIPAYLKLHDENRLEESAASINDSTVKADLSQAFTAATGWPLEFSTHEPNSASQKSSDLMCAAPVDPGVGISLGHIGLGFETGDAKSKTSEPAAQARELATPSAPEIALLPHCSPEAASHLAAAISRLFGQLTKTRQIVRHRDAELAAGVPVIARGEDSEQLAELLESVLRAGAEACECQAAALYMLDDATTSLKLRSSIGLPVERLLQPPRPLKGAIADLEALLGHAVALERASAFGPWRVPEEFAAALCVPVSSPTIPLGTLWFFSDRPRDFTDRQTNLAELVAGRLAAELERTMLLAQIREQSRS
jgi:phosphoserine phosphatase RsbU/P